MPINDKLDLKEFKGELTFTDTKRTRTGFIYHKNRQYELLFRDQDDYIGSFSPIKKGDLTLICGKDYVLNPNIPLKLYSKADELDYSERKVFLDKEHKKTN